MGGLAKMFFKVVLGDQGMTHKGLTAWNIAVRLYPPASYDDPAALLHIFFDLFKQLRIALLDPLIELGRAAGKNEIVKFLQTIQGR